MSKDDPRCDANLNKIQTMDERWVREGVFLVEQRLREVRRNLETQQDALALLISKGCRDERKLRPIREEALTTVSKSLWPGSFHADSNRHAKAGRTVRVPGERLGPWRTMFSAPLAWSGISVVNNPILLAIRRLKKRVVARAESIRGGILLENRVA